MTYLKTISFHYPSYIPRQAGTAYQLGSFTITSSGTLLEHVEFEYFGSGTPRKDYFGYSNYGIENEMPPIIIGTVGGGGDGPIGDINPDPSTPGFPSNPVSGVTYATDPWQSVYCLSDTGLALNPARFPYCPDEQTWFGARGGSLRKMSTASGLETVLEYEAATFPCSKAPQGVSSIGLRLKRETVTDNSSSKVRVRSWHYSDPVVTIPVDSLGLEPFISVSGSRNYSILANDRTFTERQYYTTGVSFHDCSRTPGASPENAVVYYGEVIEEVSGTGLDTPISTTYMYDLSHVRNPYVIRQREVPDSGRYCGTRIYDPNLILPYQSGALRALTPKIVQGYFMETFGFEPQIKKTIQWRGNPSMSDTLSVSEYFYSAEEYPDLTVGCYIENLVRALNPDMTPLILPGYMRLSHFHTFPVQTRSRRTYLDMMRTTEYDVNGNSRVTTTKYEYNNHKPGQDAASNGLLYRTVTICGDDSVSTKYTYASTHNSGVLAVNRISLLVKTETVHGGCTATTRNVYENIQGRLLLSSQTVKMNGVCIDSLSIGPHDAFANPIKAVRNGDTPTYYTWGYNGTLLTAVSTGNFLTTSYTHLPLVGCTSVTSPAGTSTTYTYEGLRPATKSIAGEVVETCSYELYGEWVNCTNNIITTKVTNPSTLAGAASRIRYDGFGNPITTAVYANSIHPCIGHTAYDILGRPVREYMPIGRSNVYDADSVEELLSQMVSQYYADTDNMPWKEYTYLPCADSRPHTATLGGEGYASHPATFTYSFNGPDTCRKYRLTSAGLRLDGYYAPGVLECTAAIDGDGRQSMTFTDFRGRTLLKRTCGETENADTYYIYDDADNIVMVLTPNASARLSTSGSLWPVSNNTVLDYTYRYSYDSKQRLVSKKMPGRDELRYWYDSTGRCIFTQDGNQRDAGRMGFDIPDNMGRPAISGECSYSEALVASIGSRSIRASRRQGITVVYAGYSVNLPMTDVQMSGAYYYDDYSHMSNPEFSAIASEPGCFNPQLFRQNNTGLLTGAIRRIYKSVGSLATETYEDYVAETYLYDYRERLSKTIQSDHRGFVNIKTSAYNNLDQPGSTASVHDYGSDREESVAYSYTYDAMGRPKTVSMTRSDSTVCLQAWRYNGIGQLDRLTLGDFRHVWYSYLTNGTLRYMSTATMGLGLGFWNTVRPSYSGNISCISLNDRNGTARTQLFEYDSFGRLGRCIYEENGNGRTDTGVLGTADYSTEYTYDLNSNPLTIKRKGVSMIVPAANKSWLLFGEIDNLRMKYVGTLLKKVTENATSPTYYGATDFNDGADEGVEYTYDANGNMTSDLNKGIVSITYNALNLPMLIEASDGSEMALTYDAAGNLLSRNAIVTQLRNGIPTSVLVTEDRFGDFTYSGNTLKRIDVPSGYISNDSLYYYIRDYQGNIRQVIDSDGEVVQENMYYPFGMLMAESSDIINSAAGHTQGSNINRYFYGAKEYLPTAGVNLYDLTGRYYDPAIAIFTCQDIFQEDCHAVSSYSYCSCDPINRIDPTGMTDFICEGYNPVYINDGLNQVIELSSENFDKLGGIDYNCSNQSYQEILASGTARNDIQYTITNVLVGKEFVPYDGTNCLDLAKLQNNTETLDAVDRIDVFTANGEADLKEGCKYVNSQLSIGKSIIAGVKTGAFHNNANSLTGHFINIVGVGIEQVNGSFINYYTYYDNATSNKDKGTNLNDNKLQLQNGPKGNYYYDAIGNVGITNTSLKVAYILTEIRRNNNNNK